MKEILKKYRVKDILPGQFLTLSPDTTLSKVLEIVFHSHQEDFPIVENSELVGFLARQDIVTNIHKFGMGKAIKDIMRKDFPTVKDTDSLVKVQNVMQENEIKAVPVLRNKTVCGVISLEDISRVYSMLSSRK